MGWVVFMRAVNVGGHQVFRPAELAKQLAPWDVVNIGAAGTFVVREALRQNVLREQVRQRLPFEASFVLCRGTEVEKLVAAEPFPTTRTTQDLRHSISILEKRPKQVPPFPLSQPEGAAWQVRIVGLQGPFVLVVWRRTGKRLLYPNEVVEKLFGVAATTRTWDTVLKVHRALQGA